MTNEIDNKSEMIIMNSYKVSVIIPCYNAENYIDYMFESVKNQTIGLDNIELLFIYDNKTTDNTKNKLLSLQKKYDNIKIIICADKSVRGAGIPRNIGILNATSDYVLFLDQDDRLENNAIERLYDEISKNNVDLVKSNFSLLIDNQIIKLSSKHETPLFINPNSASLINISDDMVWGCIYNRQFLINNHILFNNELGEDSYFIAQCIINTHKPIILIDNFYSVIYTSDNQNSYSHTYNLKKLKSHIKTQENILDAYITTKQNQLFINTTYKRFILNEISNVLRSYEGYSNKKNMINMTRDFILKYKEYNPKLTSIWKLFYILFVKKTYVLIYLSSKCINLLFNSKIFNSLQLKIRKQGWKTLKD